MNNVNIILTSILYIPICLIYLMHNIDSDNYMGDMEKYRRATT
jgi:hypothetical protein